MRVKKYLLINFYLIAQDMYTRLIKIFDITRSPSRDALCKYHDEADLHKQTKKSFSNSQCGHQVIKAEVIKEKTAPMEG